MILYHSRNLYGDNKDPSTIYPVVDNDQFYRKDPYDNEIYAYINGLPVFAIKRNHGPYYARNHELNEYYPRNELNGREQIIFVTKSSKTYPLYAYKHFGKPFYPKDEHGHEYIPMNGSYIVFNSEIIYPLNAGGQPIYPKRANGSNYYLNDTHIAKDKYGQSIYLRNENGDEFYPLRNVARDKDGWEIYAMTHDGKVVFPKDLEGNEYYLKQSDGSENVFLPNGYFVQRYARDKNGNEIYPKIMHKISQTTYELNVLLLGYAKKNNGSIFYPKDENGNEYISIPLNETDLKSIFPIGYPITHDNFYIIPYCKQTSLLSKDINPNIQEFNIVGKLFRESTGYGDLVTNVKSNTRTSDIQGKPYKVISKIPNDPEELHSRKKRESPDKKIPLKPSKPKSSFGILRYLIFSFIALLVFIVGFIWVKKDKILKLNRVSEKIEEQR